MSLTATEKIQINDTIFSGTVIDRDYQGGFIFNVDKIWKGELPDGYVNGGRDPGMCGTSFDVGSSYLVYADYRNDQYVTNMCSDNMLLSKATDDIQILDDLLSLNWLEKYWLVILLGVVLLLTSLITWTILRTISKKRTS